jgi:hypothetical protein
MSANTSQGQSISDLCDTISMPSGKKCNKDLQLRTHVSEHSQGQSISDLQDATGGIDNHQLFLNKGT